MKVLKKLDKVLEEARKQVEEEVGSLMGVTFKLSPLLNKLASKEDYFEEQAEKKIVANIDISGDIEGCGGLVISVKDAIRLGGTLIMLPHAELEEVVKSENYTEEIEDSYGEIANIVAGAYTKVFEDMYPQNCRFVRKEQAVITPLKVEVDSDEPFLNQWYYWVKAGMTIDDHTMDDLDMLIPAEAFGLEIPGVEQSFDVPEEHVEIEAENDSAEVAEPEEEKIDDEIDTKQHSKHKQVDEVAAAEVEVLSDVELEKQQKKVNKLLKNCSKLISEEVSALLGVDIRLKNPVNKIISKEEFFLEEISGKQILTHMDVVDETEDKSYLFISVKDAIRAGSILIMLPPSELESAVSEEDFTADTEDAYGEIANIISGVYTQVFQDQYSKNMRFVKTDLERVAPMKVDTDSDEVIPNQNYYLSSCGLVIDDKECGDICMLFPAQIVKLSQLGEAKQSGEPATAGSGSAAVGSSSSSASIETATVTSGSSEAGSSSPSTSGVIPAHGGDQQPPGAADVLIIENHSEQAAVICQELQSIGVRAKIVSFNDNISKHLTSDLRLIFIVMGEVDEQAYGVTIKVNTQSTAPIVAASSEWTRSKVIKAVKYGVHDILLTPAQAADIREKVEHNIIKLAA